jgi:Lar family restriction alleviation protein
MNKQEIINGFEKLPKWEQREVAEKIFSTPKSDPYEDVKKYKLKSCPFCGSKKLKIRDDEAVIGTWQVVCDECRAAGGNRGTQEEVIEAWNQRVGR